MKLPQLFLGIVCLFTATISIAQEEPTNEKIPLQKGTFYLGANSNLNSGISKVSSTEYAEPRKSYNYNISSEAGYFIINDLLIGSGFRLSFNGNKSESDDDFSKGNSVSFNPFVRYYFDTKTIKPFVELASGIGYGKNTNRVSSSNDLDTFDTKTKSFEVSGAAGIAFFVNRSISIDLALQYTNFQDKRESDYESDFDFGFGSDPFNSFSRSERFNLRAGFSLFL